MSHKRNLSSVSLLVAVLVALAPKTSASDVIGKVVLSGEPKANVVVSIEDLKLETPPDAKVYVIDHHNLNFVPHLLVIRAGDRVRFENSDAMPCHIYSISPAETFVLRGQEGKPVTITFDRPGVIEVRCSQHNRIYAFILVKENPYFALSDAKGRYKITKVPPGRYTLRAWYEGQVIDTRTIEVGAAKLKVDFKAAQPQPRALSVPSPDLVSGAPDAAARTTLQENGDHRSPLQPEMITSWRKQP